jgi:putative nucleotidyltransferase with HDIG domain
MCAESAHASYPIAARGHRDCDPTSPVKPFRPSQADTLRAVADVCASTLEALSHAVNERDSATKEHARRVQRNAVALARETGIVDEALLTAIASAALLHDLGKVGIPEHLLNKPGPLDDREFEQVKQHAVIGAQLLEAASFPPALIAIVRHHHENWDGSGYPDKLREGEIPIGARLLALIDCYDALTSDRPYRRALSRERAVAMIRARRGTMYDPAVVAAFLRIQPELRCAVECEHHFDDSYSDPVARRQTTVHVQVEEAPAS